MAELILASLNFDVLLDFIQPEEVGATADEVVDEKVADLELVEEDGVVVATTPTLNLTLLDLVKKAAINLFLPFINGVMLGFGEIAAHEIGFRYNWSGARVYPPLRLQAKRAKSNFL